ncbi:hypothetical protein DPMN_009949 [Dreissena polymorpha]|uniref:Cytochrome P450 n=1 Tax=Dreissena polymorpha TaxID=45954 RepID=A0A9D4MXW8_DREPO|nr:hypothetical protein DPMN_009949 [Dreissena polymorpha]
MISLTDILIICTCTSSFVFIVFSCAFLYKRNRRLPPGPKGYLCCGNSFQIDSDHIHQNLKGFHDVYGKIIKFQIFGTKVISLSSAKYISEAFELNPSCQIANDRPTNSTSDIFYGRKHIGLADWNYVTSLLRDFHKLSAIRVFDKGGKLNTLFETEIKVLHLNFISGRNIDVNPHLHLRLFLQNLISILLIGETLEKSDRDRDVFWEFIDLLFVLIDPSVDGALRTFPFLRRLPGYYGSIYRQTITARDKVAKRFYEDQKTSYRPGNIRGLVDVCILNQLEELTKTGNSWLTDEHIKGLIFDTLAAGMTEILKTLRLFLLLMCHHPEVQTRLKAEVDTIIGTERFPCPEDRKWMPFTQAVMLEIWRYGSQTPLAIPHLCQKNVELDGYLIEAGSVIFPNLYAVHHDEVTWGDPWEYRPERFLNEAGELLPSDHTLMQNVIPFSVGKRECPGQDFARSRIFVTMTSLMQRVQVVPPKNSNLPPADPRLYSKAYPMTEPQFECRFLSRENIII